MYRAYVRSVLQGLARNRFRNIVLINGHGGGQTAVLGALAQEVGRETSTRILKEGHGYPRFDPARAKVYFDKVNDKIARLVETAIRQWDAAGLMRSATVVLGVRCGARDPPILVSRAIVLTSGEKKRSILWAECARRRGELLLDLSQSGAEALGE